MPDHPTPIVRIIRDGKVMPPDARAPMVRLLPDAPRSEMQPDDLPREVRVIELPDAHAKPAAARAAPSPVARVMLQPAQHVVEAPREQRTSHNATEMNPRRGTAHGVEPDDAA